MSMDYPERMTIRSHADWVEILRTKGLKFRCPGCGETRSEGFEIHHIAGVRFGEECTVMCVICHRVLTRRQQTEHPEPLEDPPSQEEKDMHFLLGLSDIRELQVDQLRRLAENKLTTVLANKKAQGL
jgi:hypothetical protein